MGKNIFLEENKEISLSDYMNYDSNGRSNLGTEIPITVYRLMEYSLREELADRFGRQEQIQVFRNAGFRAGTFFADHYLNLQLPFHEFLSHLQKTVADLKIGILRIESIDEKSGSIVLTVAEDADCSGLPLLGDTVCNYDEGFLSGIFSAYTQKRYSVIEIDCWGTGARACRFSAEIDKVTQ